MFRNRNINFRLSQDESVVELATSPPRAPSGGDSPVDNNVIKTPMTPMSRKKFEVRMNEVSRMCHH